MELTESSYSNNNALFLPLKCSWQDYVGVKEFNGIVFHDLKHQIVKS